LSEQIYVGADHAGFRLKQKLVDELARLGYEPVDVGPKALDPADDFPDYGRPVAAAVSEGHLFRPVGRGDLVRGLRMSEKIVWQMLKTYVAGAGLPDIAPHDLRRTTAKLCRAAGGELEQIQLLLGHSSVQTTERYLGTRQDLAHAPNDAIKLKLAV